MGRNVLGDADVALHLALCVVMGMCWEMLTWHSTLLSVW